MTTQNSPPRPPSNLFWGPYYNRRPPSLERPKPLISKLAGAPTWVCRVRGSDGTTAGNCGFGFTPTAAYNAWKRARDQWC